MTVSEPGVLIEKRSRHPRPDSTLCWDCPEFVAAVERALTPSIAARRDYSIV